MSKHADQPFVDIEGVERFQANPIVRYLLDNGGIDLNGIARQGFDADDEQHFAQLIGYSRSGWGGLSYVTDEDWERTTERGTYGHNDAGADR